MKKTTIILLALSLSFLGGCKLLQDWFGKKTTTEPVSTEIIQKTSVIEISTPEEYEKEVINSNKPTVLKFTAEWCGACKVFEPIYEKVANKLKDKIKFVVADLDAFVPIAQEHNVFGVPALLFFKDGKLVEKIEGGTTEQEFIEKVNTIFELKK